MIMAYSSWKPKIQYLIKLEYCEIVKYCRLKVTLIKQRLFKNMFSSTWSGLRQESVHHENWSVALSIWKSRSLSLEEELRGTESKLLEVQLMRYCQEADKWHETKQCRRAEGCYWSNLGFHNSAEQQANRLPLRIDAVNAKWVQVQIQ